MGKTLEDRLKQSRFAHPMEAAMLNLLVAAAHLRDRVERLCAPHGISQVQYNVLRILRGAHPGGHARCEIASRMVERAPDVTRLIDRLERLGLAERIRSEGDRRLSVTRITRKGLRVLDQVQPGLDRTFQELSARLSAADAEHLSRLCERIYAPGDSARSEPGDPR